MTIKLPVVIESKFTQLIKSALLCFVLVGCASNQALLRLEPISEHQAWISEITQYQLYANDGDQYDVNQVLTISDSMRENVKIMFDFLPPSEAAETLAHWLIDEDGHNMIYDVTANYSPIDAYQLKKGNCLSFTLLLASLATEVNAEIEFNAVDIPSSWGMDEELGMVFYRHVNGILRTAGKKKVFDLAMGSYNAGFPQRTITRDQAVALLHNNFAIDELREGNLAAALHHSKLAVSLSSTNADLWVNLGVIKKHQNDRESAEIAFLEAIRLDRHNLAAASNLERYYLEDGNLAKAELFASQAEVARTTNPYFHYQASLDFYRDQQFRKSNKSIKQAIFLHDKDPRFFELKSRIAQQQYRYADAIRDLTKAYKIASDHQQRTKYFDKAELVSQLAIKEAERRELIRRSNRNDGLLLNVRR